MVTMENREEILLILERFTRLKQKEIPKELEEYFQYVARTGDTVFKWASLKYLFREKLLHVIKHFNENAPRVEEIPQYPNVDPFNFETMKSSLLERLDLFNAAPFTVQRLCELLIDPRKQYTRIDKYMRALEKNILVSTIEPGRKRNESENGDSLDSMANGDLSLDVNIDIEMESEGLLNNTESQNGNGNANVSEIKESPISSKVSGPRTSDDEMQPKPKKVKLEHEDNELNSSNNSVPLVRVGGEQLDIASKSIAANVAESDAAECGDAAQIIDSNEQKDNAMKKEVDGNKKTEVEKKDVPNESGNRLSNREEEGKEDISKVEIPNILSPDAGDTDENKKDEEIGEEKIIEKQEIEKGEKEFVKNEKLEKPVEKSEDQSGSKNGKIKIKDEKVADVKEQEKPVEDVDVGGKKEESIPKETIETAAKSLVDKELDNSKSGKIFEKTETKTVKNPIILPTKEDEKTNEKNKSFKSDEAISSSAESTIVNPSTSTTSPNKATKKDQDKKTEHNELSAQDDEPSNVRKNEDGEAITPSNVTTTTTEGKEPIATVVVPVAPTSITSVPVPIETDEPPVDEPPTARIEAVIAKDIATVVAQVAPIIALNDQPMEDVTPLEERASPPTVDEVIMAETGTGNSTTEMATDPIELAKDEPAVMDVDDTSQEAMDQ